MRGMFSAFCVFVFGTLFQLAAALRLTVPLLYALLLPVLLPDWYHAHRQLGDGIFFLLLGLVILSWCITFVRWIRKAL